MVWNDSEPLIDWEWLGRLGNCWELLGTFWTVCSMLEHFVRIENRWKYNIYLNVIPVTKNS